MSTNPNTIKPATTKTLIKRLFIEHVRKHVSWLIIALSLMMVVAGTTAGLAFLMETILDDVFTAKSKQSLYFAASIVMSLFVAKGLATYGQTVIMSFVGQRILADLQKSMFGHLVNGDLSFFHNHSSGGLIAHFINDVEKMRGTVAGVITAIGTDDDVGGATYTLTASDSVPVIWTQGGTCLAVGLC